MEQQSIRLSFANNQLLPQLFGESNRHLKLLEQQLALTISARGEEVSIKGGSDHVAIAKSVLRTLYDRLNHGGGAVDDNEVSGLVRVLQESFDEDVMVIETAKKGARKKGTSAVQKARNIFTPHSKQQETYWKSLMKQDLVFGMGPAGTGKTYLAVAAAVQKYLNGDVKRIILSRPAVEAGENLGFLPGDLKEKVDPYLQPIYDALNELLGVEKANKMIDAGDIEIAPLAFMRGRTLKHAAIILDEAQNTTRVQMKMFLTRMGEGSNMAITGDISQLDLPRGTTSGFQQAMNLLGGIDGIDIVKFEAADIVRHPLTAKIVEAYERDEAAA